MKIIKGKGIIRINDTGCEIQTTDTILTPDKELTIKLYNNFIPKTDMTELFDKMTKNELFLNSTQVGVHHDIKFTDMRENHKIMRWRK